MITVINLKEEDMNIGLLGENLVIKPNKELWITLTWDAVRELLSSANEMARQLQEKEE